MFNEKEVKKITQPILAISLLFLCSCSTTFAYNNLPWLSSFWVDDYIDLNKSQSEQLELIIKDTRNWHRQVELLKYKQDLNNVQKMFNGQPSLNEVNQQVTIAKQHWGNLLAYAQLPLIKLAKTLTPQQREELVSNISNELSEELAEHNELNKQGHKDKRLEQQLSYYKEWLGKLSNHQAQLIHATNELHVSTFELWQRYKQNRLNALETLFANTQRDDIEFTKQLGLIITEREYFMDSELIEKNNSNRMRYVDLLMALNNTLSDKQRRHANAKFVDLIDTIDDLIAD